MYNSDWTVYDVAYRETSRQTLAVYDIVRDGKS